MANEWKARSCKQNTSEVNPGKLKVCTCHETSRGSNNCLLDTATANERQAEAKSKTRAGRLSISADTMSQGRHMPRERGIAST